MDVTPLYGLGNLSTPYDFKNQRKLVRDHMEYMLTRTTRMFEYDGLPETIPSYILETYLQMNGMVCIFKEKDMLYASFGGWGGEPNEYYIPTQFVVANPYLNIFKTFTNGVDCVIIRNDSEYKGLRSMFQRYATALATNDVSMILANINTRIISLIEAPDDKTKASAEEYLRKIQRGDMGIVASNAFLEGLKTSPFAGTNASSIITQLIELQQYYKASWYNELGLQANYNMKREAINSNESQLNEDALVPLIDDMLMSRQEGFAEVERLFGVKIDVSYGSVWEENEQERDMSLFDEMNARIAEQNAGNPTFGEMEEQEVEQIDEYMEADEIEENPDSEPGESDNTEETEELFEEVTEEAAESDDEDDDEDEEDDEDDEED